MRSVTTILILVVPCLMLHAAEDESRKAPKLHESLKEFEWLIGEWTHASEYVTGDAEDGLVLHPLLISPSDDGRKVTVTYQYAFVNKSGLGPHRFSCKEVLAYNADQEGLTVTYVTKFAGNNFIERGGEGHGKYMLKKVQANQWSGDASFVDARSPTRTCTSKVSLTKIDDDRFRVSLTDRRGYYLLPAHITVELGRRLPGDTQTRK